MSDTPRTDANTVRGFDALRITNDEEEWVRSDFARQLEHELVAAKLDAVYWKEFADRLLDERRNNS